MSSVAFFPVYPLATRAVGTILPGGDTLAALVVTAVSGLDAFLLLRRWCATRLDASETRGTLVALALYPFSWFLFGAA